jgi:hypothetical protein
METFETVNFSHGGTEFSGGTRVNPHMPIFFASMGSVTMRYNRVFKIIAINQTNENLRLTP